MTDTEPDLPEGSVEMARITIVKTFDDNAEGGAACYVAYSDGLSLIDALGMLSFATWATPDTFTTEETP